MPAKLLNLAAFQAGWLLCVLGAGAGRPWVGPLAAPFILAAGTWRAPRPLRALAFYLQVALAGAAVDALLGLAGSLRYEGAGPGGILPPLWLPTLWALLATTLDSSLRWLQSRLVAAALLGLAGGPLAYLAGARLGAVGLGEPLFRSLLFIGLAWAAAMPLLALWARHRREPLSCGLSRNRPSSASM